MALGTPSQPNTAPGVAQAVSQSGVWQVEITDGTNVANILNGNGTATGQNSELVAGAYMEKSWSVTSPQAVLVTDVANYKWVSIHITSQYVTSTVNFQASNDNQNWFQVNLLLSTATGNTGLVGATGSALGYYGPLNFRYFRLNITGAYVSGTCAGIVEFYTTPSVLHAPNANVGGTVGANSTVGSASPSTGFYMAANGAGNVLSALQMGSNLGGSQANQNAGSFLATLLGVYNGSTYDTARGANPANNTTGIGLLGVGLLGFDGTNYQRIKVSANNELFVTGNAPSGTALNTYEVLITTATTTTVTAATAYISSIAISIDVGGAGSTITIQDGQATPVILVNGLATATASTGPTIYNFQTPIKMTSGIKIITTSVTPATDSVWINYYQ